MFDSTLECGIRAVKVKAREVDGRPVRRCRVTLAHEFTEQIAREPGPDAVAVRKALRSNGIDKASMPIDGIAALGALTAGSQSVQIQRLCGIKATCVKAKDADEGPTIQLEFEFSWDPDAWLFLGQHCNAVAEVVLTNRQLALAYESGEAN